MNLLESSIMLFYYSKKRISSKVISNQNDNIAQKNNKTLRALSKLTEEAIKLKQNIKIQVLENF